MTRTAAARGQGASARTAGWLRPVQLCLATSIRGPDGRTWPHPAAFVWGTAEADQLERREALEALLQPASCVVTDEPVLAVYRITKGAHVQAGLLADVRVGAYEAGRVKGHERTRYDKEEALYADLDEVEALVGPVALAHRPDAGLAELLDDAMREDPTGAWTSADGAEHELWVVEGPGLAELEDRCEMLDPLYVLDGHHRIAAAARRAAARRAAGATHEDDPWEAFLAAVFPSDRLAVRAIHRVVDLDGGTPEAVQARLSTLGMLTPVNGLEEARPRGPRRFGVGLDGQWFRLEGLDVPAAGGGIPYPDVQALDDLVLGPALGIEDPRTDPRIDFVPDANGLGVIAERVRSGRAVVFLVHTMPVDEVFGIADAGVTLPPKSTWFDPKPIRGAMLPAERLPRAPG